VHGHRGFESLIFRVNGGVITTHKINKANQTPRKPSRPPVLCYISFHTFFMLALCENYSVLLQLCAISPLILSWLFLEKTSPHSGLHIPCVGAFACPGIETHVQGILVYISFKG
jgi:hypothetical protein